MLVQAVVAFAVGILSVTSVQAMAVDQTYVKSELEKRFALTHVGVGMAATHLASKDCDIQIVDGASTSSAADQAFLEVAKGGQTLRFEVSEKMSYDVSLGSFIDLTANQRSGFATHSMLLKISDSKLAITELALYPSDLPDGKTTTLLCHF